MSCTRQSANGCVAPATSRRPFSSRERDHLAAQVVEIGRRFLDVRADAGADLDHRLVHLGLHLLLHPPLALVDDLGGDVRAQVERDGIDRLVFLFDPDGEGGFFH